MNNTETVYKGVTYSADVIADMRKWIKDCQWADLEPDEVNDLDAIEILQGVNRGFDGGLIAYMNIWDYYQRDITERKLRKTDQSGEIADIISDYIQNK